LLSGTCDGYLATAVEVDDADGVGPGVRDVGAASLGIDADEVRLAMDADGGGNGVGRGVDDSDGAGLGVYGIDLVADRIRGNSGGIVADAKGAVLAQVNEVEDADSVGAAVGNVGELAVSGGDIGEAAAAAAGDRDEGEKDSERTYPKRIVGCRH
jgi:hypothetical protein